MTDTIAEAVVCTDGRSAKNMLRHWYRSLRNSVLEKEWRDEGKRVMYLRQIDGNDKQKNNKKSLFCTAVLLAAAAGVFAAGVKAEAAPDRKSVV